MTGLLVTSAINAATVVFLLLTIRENRRTLRALRRLEAALARIDAIEARRK